MLQTFSPNYRLSVVVGLNGTIVSCGAVRFGTSYIVLTDLESKTS